jgi:hypothetical protein
MGMSARRFRVRNSLVGAFDFSFMAVNRCRPRHRVSGRAMSMSGSQYCEIGGRQQEWRGRGLRCGQGLWCGMSGLGRRKAAKHSATRAIVRVAEHPEARPGRAEMPVRSGGGGIRTHKPVRAPHFEGTSPDATGTDENRRKPTVPRLPARGDPTGTDSSRRGAA